jgi:hypothetical protein
MRNAHEREEQEFGRERLWDADPDVCCAAFQLGACRHTESYVGDEDEDEVMTEAQSHGMTEAQYALTLATQTTDDEPF